MLKQVGCEEITTLLLLKTREITHATKTRDKKKINVFASRSPCPSPTLFRFKLTNRLPGLYLYKDMTYQKYFSTQAISSGFQTPSSLRGRCFSEPKGLLAEAKD